MTRPQWKPDRDGFMLKCGIVEAHVYRDGKRWGWIIYQTDRGTWELAHDHGRLSARPQTAARHALAWVRKHLTPIVEVADDEPEGLK